LGKIRSIANELEKHFTAIGRIDQIDDSVLSESLNETFEADFDSFLSSISTQFAVSSQLNHCSKEVFSDIFLSSAIVCVLNEYEFTLLPWKNIDIIQSSRVFRRKCLSTSYSSFVTDVLFLRADVPYDRSMIEKFKVVESFSHVWDHFRSLSYYEHPARVLLSSWVKHAMELIKALVVTFCVLYCLCSLTNIYIFS
jgi:hypothetical protein